MRLTRGCGLVLTSLIMVSRTMSAADAPEFAEYDRSYQSEIRPLISRHCEKCHSSEVMEAEIDLSSFTSLAAIRKHPGVWQKVGEMLDSGQMPPKDAPQPTEADRTRRRSWMDRLQRSAAANTSRSSVRPRP